MVITRIRKVAKILISVIIIISALNYILPKYIIVNKTPSIREGVYLLLPYDEKNPLEIGDIVIFDIPEDIEKFIKERQYISDDTHTFIKKVGATEGMKIEIKDNRLFINGINEGEVSSTDSLKRNLPQIDSFIVSKGHFFPIGTHLQSFDGRYYGEIDMKTIKNKAKLLIGF